MTRLIIGSFLSLLFFQHASGQYLVLKGRVKCYNQHQSSSKGAENVVVVPTFLPAKSTITASAPPGYYEINTNILFEDLRDKQVHLYVVSKCSQCKLIARRVFISEDQEQRSSDKSKAFVTLKDWKLDGNCTDAELTPFKADSVLAVVMKQPSVDVKGLSSATAAVGAPPLLNLLSTLAGIPAVTATGDFFAEDLEPGITNYGQFLLSSPMHLSSNTGFNFSPARNFSEVMFWNPAAIAASKDLHSASLFTNLRNNLKLGGFLGLTEKLSLGAGFLYTKQSEARTVLYNSSRSDPDNGNRLREPHIIELDEYAVYLSPVLKLNPKLSIGVTAKLLNQHFNAPDSMSRRNNNSDPEFFDKKISRNAFDADLSLCYKLTGAFQVGLNLMNLTGAELYDDAFVAGNPNPTVSNQRAAGLGLTYKWQRFNFGSDLLFTEDGLYDVSFGVNYVPFNNAVVQAGIAVKQLSYSASFQLKNFRISYVQDNGALPYERRSEKISFFDGRLYTGFSFFF